MYCKSCQQSFKENIKECPNCGSKLINNETDINNNNVHLQKSNNNFKKIPTKIAVAVSCIALFTIIGVLGKNYFVKESEPSDKIISTFLSILDSNQSEIQTLINFKNTNLVIDEDEEIYTDLALKIIQASKIKTNIKQDRKNDKYQIDITLQIKENEFITGNIYFDKDIIIIDLGELYNRKFYIKWEDYNKLATTSGLKNITIKPYIDLVLDIENLNSIKKFNRSKYIDLFKHKIQDHITVKENQKVNTDKKNIKVDKYTLEIDQDLMMDISSTLMTKLINDKQIEPVMQEIIDKMLADMEQRVNIDKLEVKELEKIKNIVQNYKQNKKILLEQLEKSMKLANDLNNEQKNIYNFYFKKNDLIMLESSLSLSAIDLKSNQKISTNIETETKIISTNQPINFIDSTVKNDINLAELKKEELEEIYSSLKTSLKEYALKNPKLLEVIGEIIQ